MPEIDMPPQYAGHYSDPQDTEGKVRAAAQILAADNVNLWATFVLDTVSDFESDAVLHIDQLEYDRDATYRFNPVLSSFAETLIDFFPLSKPAKMAKDVVKSVMNGLQDSYTQQLEGGLRTAKLRLRASVRALAKAARERTTKAASGIRQRLPEAVEDGMTWVDSASTDPDYVSELVDWMGFPLPTRENTVYPVRQALENPFFGVYQAVRAQLLRTQGVPGVRDDQLSPTIWEHEALESQRKAYDTWVKSRFDGPPPWEEAYKR
jgi:hypothetical protein